MAMGRKRAYACMEREVLVFCADLVEYSDFISH